MPKILEIMHITGENLKIRSAVYEKTGEGYNSITGFSEISSIMRISLNKDELEAAFVELNLDIPENFFLVRINTDENVYIKKIIRK